MRNSIRRKRKHSRICQSRELQISPVGVSLRPTLTSGPGGIDCPNLPTCSVHSLLSLSLSVSLWPAACVPVGLVSLPRTLPLLLTPQSFIHYDWGWWSFPGLSGISHSSAWIPLQRPTFFPFCPSPLRVPRQFWLGPLTGESRSRLVSFLPSLAASRTLGLPSSVRLQSTSSCLVL